MEQISLSIIKYSSGDKEIRIEELTIQEGKNREAWFQKMNSVIKMKCLNKHEQLTNVDCELDVTIIKGELLSIHGICCDDFKDKIVSQFQYLNQ